MPPTDTCMCSLIKIQRISPFIESCFKLQIYSLFALVYSLFKVPFHKKGVLHVSTYLERNYYYFVTYQINTGEAQVVVLASAIITITRH